MVAKDPINRASEENKNQYLSVDHFSKFIALKHLKRITLITL